METSKYQLFLDAPMEIADERFQRILNSCFAKSATLPQILEPEIFWGASAFGLDRVTSFNQLSFDAQSRVLSTTSQDLLREAAFIEMAGLSYTARMSLESNKLDERLFYSMMASEEATHFQMLKPFVSNETFAKGPDEFTALIGEMIATADRESVIFLVQVILEGWGLTHFSWMASNCLNETLRNSFKTILKDEARHHAAGTAMLKSSFGKGDKKVIAWIEQILAMVQVGPLRLLTALESVVDARLSKEQVFTELKAEASTRERLFRLRGLLENHFDQNVLARFEEKGLFEPSF